METTYVIHNWESAPQIKNHLDPKLKIEVLAYREYDDEGKFVLKGYNLKVINPKYSKMTRVVYAFDIDMGDPGHYSLTTDEAIDFLNKVGFDCRFDHSTYEIPENVRDQLTAFRKLGYNVIVRTTSSSSFCGIFLSTNPTTALKYFENFDPKKLIPNYKTMKWLPDGFISPGLVNYHDYDFLEVNKPTIISEILEK